MDVRRELEQLVRSALDDDPRIALIAIRRLASEQLPWLEERAVRLARQQGWAWAPIARLLQITRQAAFRRFRDLDRQPPRPPRRELAPGEIDERAFLDLQRQTRHRDELRAWEASGTDIVPW